MSYKNKLYHLRGIAPLLCHNGTLADRLSYHAKELAKVSSKRVKTDADFERMAEIEFKGALYLDETEGPVLPGTLVEGMLTETAGKLRKRPKIKAGVVVEGAFRLEYEGPRDADALFADRRFRLTCGVRIQKNRIMRTRPRFPEWRASVLVQYLPSVINPAEIDEIMALGGEQVGVGDWRPRYGRFEVVTTG